MIKLFSLKQQKKDGESPRGGTQKKASAAQLRIMKGKISFSTGFLIFTLSFINQEFEVNSRSFIFSFLDVNELNLPKTCQLEHPDPDDLLSFKITICPDEVRAKNPI